MSKESTSESPDGGFQKTLPRVCSWDRSLGDSPEESFGVALGESPMAAPAATLAEAPAHIPGEVSVYTSGVAPGYGSGEGPLAAPGETLGEALGVRPQ